jgi:hypothetical protein
VKTTRSWLSLDKCYGYYDDKLDNGKVIAIVQDMGVVARIFLAKKW